MIFPQGINVDRLTEWLLAGPSWIEYRTRVDLLEQPEDVPEVRKAREAMLVHPSVKKLIDELGGWPGPILKSHKSAGHLLHKLTFVADLGIRAEDAGISQIIQRIQIHQSEEGPYQVLVNINPKYGGTGENQYVWMLCDAPLVLYALTKFGLGGSLEVQQATSYLVALIRENGWPCDVAPALGKFRGPGRKSDPCPYANLLMLKLLVQFPDYHRSESVRIGVETLLSLWEQRNERRPYLFAMGSDFAKLKAPLIWYDILHVVDVLTQVAWARNDSRLLEMVDMIESKVGEDEQFRSESVWRDWTEWEFGQKSDPSYWITLIAHRISRRVNGSFK